MFGKFRVEFYSEFWVYKTKHMCKFFALLFIFLMKKLVQCETMKMEWCDCRNILRLFYGLILFVLLRIFHK